MIKALILAAGLAGVSRAAEVHNGVTFEVRYGLDAPVETQPQKIPYEDAAAAQAIRRLRDVLKTDNMTPNCLKASSAESAPALYDLKECIVREAGGSEDIFFALLSDDIEEANKFWDKLITESTTDRTEWVATQAVIKAYFDGALTATQFSLWTMSPKADEANNRANPEHYVKKSIFDPESLSGSAAILEGWGGVESSRFGTQRTNFTVPAYIPPKFGSAEHPASWNPGEKFNLAMQRIGNKVLASGSKKTLGVLNIAVRDVKKDEEGNETGKDGIEIYASVWYPPWDKAADEADRKEFVEEYLKDEARHAVVEIVNLTLQAKEDCKDGSCSLPGQ